MPLLSMRSVAEIVLESLSYLQEKNRLTLYAYVIMENHLHMVAVAEDLSRQLATFKSYTARRIIDHLSEVGMHSLLQQLRAQKLAHKTDRQYQFWQEGSHPVQIQNAEVMREKIEYIHNNPVRRGYVEEAVYWRYSSATDYAGQRGLLDVETDWH
jgi:putative transposase